MADEEIGIKMTSLQNKLTNLKMELESAVDSEVCCYNSTCILN